MPPKNDSLVSPSAHLGEPEHTVALSGNCSRSAGNTIDLPPMSSIPVMETGEQKEIIALRSDVNRLKNEISDLQIIQLT